MGRYTTVQTYTDQDKVAPISYSAATKAQDESKETVSSIGTVKPQKFHLNRVENVMGSSAGAGSGEFHMYRVARRREQDRLSKIEKEYNEKRKQEEFQQKRKREQEILQHRALKKANRRRKRKENAKSKSLITKVIEEKENESYEEIPNDGTFLARMLAKQQSATLISK